MSARPSSTSAFQLFNVREHAATYMAILCVAILMIAAVLRLSQYMANRSLWLDEAMLALNIVNRSFIGLTQPLDYVQGAPLGFLFLQKLMTVLFGNMDYVLRIVPLVCGLTSIWLMYALAEHVFIERLSVVAAIILFAVSDRLIYYTSEVKQYSSDVLICLVLLLTIVRGLDRNLGRRDFALLAALGAGALWFSHPAVFTLVGAGSALGVHFILNRDRRSILMLACVVGFWLLSLAILYFVSLRELAANSSLLEYWN